MTLVEQHRDEIELLLQKRPELAANGRVFDAPWQARVFALIVALVKQGHLSWKIFQSELVKAVSGESSDEAAQPSEMVETQYYESWLIAAENALKSLGHLQDGELAEISAKLRAAADEIRNSQMSQGS